MRWPPRRSPWSRLPAPLRRHWPEIAWAVFAAYNVVLMLIIVGGATIPFHFIWLSLTIVYGFRVWRLRTTLWVLGAVCLVAGAALAYDTIQIDGHFEELTEVPMMALMFLAMVWHAQRRQSAVDKLELAAVRERDFARDASHQLRTPITIARTHAELLRMELNGDHQAGDDADLILDELKRLGRISDRLLFLAMADARDLLAKAPFDLGRLVSDTAGRWTNSEPRDWRIEIEAEGTLLGDAERLEATLDALIENAVRATEAGDEIAIRLSSHGNSAMLEISDRGTGVPADDPQRIFDRFWHASHPGSVGRGGTGLGLAMVKAITEAHGGSARALRRPGGGTTILLTFQGFVPVSGREAVLAAS